MTFKKISENKDFFKENIGRLFVVPSGALWDRFSYCYILQNYCLILSPFYLEYEGTIYADEKKNIPKNRRSFDQMANSFYAELPSDSESEILGQLGTLAEDDITGIEALQALIDGKVLISTEDDTYEIVGNELIINGKLNTVQFNCILMNNFSLKNA